METYLPLHIWTIPTIMITTRMNSLAIMKKLCAHATSRTETELRTIRATGRTDNTFYLGECVFREHRESSVFILLLYIFNLG